MRIAVFASGNGSNFSAIHQAVVEGRLNVEIACVVYDKKDAYVKHRAQLVGVPTHYFSLKAYNDKKSYEQAILRKLVDERVECIVLAGYMKIIGETLLTAYENCILNIHPAYLPEFPGKQGIVDAFEAGVSQTGVTVHLVDNGVDTGRILRQERVPILPSDTLETLEARIHQVEHRLYPETLQQYIKYI